MLKTIRFKNFLAVGNYWIEVPLDQYKTTLIVGRNGSGKSSLLDALSFVLFNKPFRKINKPQLCNSITNKDCVVEIEFTINNYNFKVVRGIKPTIFEIYKDGELITQNADNRDYQDAFEKYILKINQKTFCQIVVLGSAIFTPFMALTTPERRKIIEDLLDLEIFGQMNILLKKQQDDCDIHITSNTTKKTLITERIKLTQEHYEQMSESRENIKSSHQNKIDELIEQMNELQLFNDKMNKVKDELDKITLQLPSLEKTNNEIINIKQQLSRRSQKINKEILFYQNNETCPTCNQNIDNEFKIKTIFEKERTAIELDDALTKIEVKLTSIQTKINNVETAQTKRNNIVNEIQTKNIMLKHNQKTKDEIEQQIRELDNSTFEFDFSKLEEMRMELSDIDNILKDMSDDQTVMEYAGLLLKDSGIKGKIIKTFIPVINQLIQKYLASLDFFVDFHLDEQFNETILSRHRDNFSYMSFSEGEKMRLNLAILFTWRAIARLRSSINCNVLIFDELLDSSLDNEGIDDILRVIGNLTENDNVVIISHREDQISDKFSKIMRFEKIKNFSKVIE